MALVACSEGPPTAGQPVDFSSVCDKANDGHRVAVDGYLRLPDQIEVFRSSSGFGDKVKVSGTVYFPTSLADVEFSCALSNILVEAPTPAA
ncbi:MAG: hypothetical protein JO352_34145 [Chloroflexi bacterium]|nr:hypothetical protein [Chloroflexota bacterium]